MNAKQRTALLTTLEDRFAANMGRHKGLTWADVAARLEKRPEALRAIAEMERTGGEPDVVGQDATTGAFVVMDCVAESPDGRRSVCYDREALDSRKEHKPAHSAMEMAAGMGVELLTEEQYAQLQAVGKFDTKTSSWLKTPDALRKLGGALFGDRRYNRVFVYHNGAQSYYAARGFRGVVQV